MSTVAPGTLDSRVLTQEHYWVTVDAIVLPLGAMTEAHLSAVVRFLLTRATLLHLDAMVDALADLIEARALGETTAEQLMHDLTGQSIASVSPDAWFESTPLLRALRRELARRREAAGPAASPPGGPE